MTESRMIYLKHVAFIAAALLADFGWQDIIDLGDMRAARGTEMLLPVWLSLWKVIGNPYFGFKIVGR